jgi:DNA anti-recombination protein RmuC
MTWLLIMLLSTSTVLLTVAVFWRDKQIRKRLDLHRNRIDRLSKMLQRIDGQVERLERQLNELAGDGK